MSKWQKGIVEWVEGNTAHISVVFTWDAHKAFARASHYRQSGYDVRVGGPGVFVLGKQFREVATVGGELPDVVRRHNPIATFASRGCPVGCWFCIVPAMEGREFTLIPDFPPRPVLCDNNISALPPEYQDHIIDRYRKANVPLLDANSGFEPATFDQDVFDRWKPINQGPWRFAFDESGERADVERVMVMLRDVPPRMKRVYVLIGNEPFQSCLDRVNEVIAWGGEPHVQPLMKLNALVKEPWVREEFGWSRQSLVDMARWANGWVWRKCSFDEYDRNKRTDDQAIDDLTMQQTFFELLDYES